MTAVGSFEERKFFGVSLKLNARGERNVTQQGTSTDP